MSRTPEVDEDAVVFLLPHAGASPLAGDPVFEGRLREALRHAMEEVPEADLRRCIIRTLSGDQFGEAEIRHLYGEHVRPA